jgi:hypothetical protein
MLARHVAIVSQANRVTLSQLMVTAAAIQKQITRDFGPIWEIDADVAAFADLSDVPLGYWPIIIANDIPIDAHGIHLNQQNGQPFALVEFSDNWTLTTSHECLEMLADPSGNRIQAGDPYRIPAHMSFQEGSRGPEGRVGYLVEVCDPCEAAQFAYSVNGVLVSDFYTPNFFDPGHRVRSVRYSFTVAITEPREVLDGGYLSWIQPETKSLSQVFVNGKDATLKSHTLPENIVNLRRYSDKHSVEHRKNAMIGKYPKRDLLLTSTISNVKGGPPSDNLDRTHRDNSEWLRGVRSGQGVKFPLGGNIPPSR